MVWITENKYINKILQRINSKSIHNDIWQDVIDYRNGTALRFTCGNTIYTGVLVCHEEKGNDSWFILQDFIVEENNECYRSEDMSCNAKMAINLKNVDRVELFYGEPKKSQINNIKNLIKSIIKRKSKKEQEN